MKKALSIIAVVALTLSMMVLSSCGEKPNGNDPQSKSNGTTSSTTKDVEKQVEEDRSFWRSSALPENKYTTYTAMELFKDDYDEILAATTVSDVSANAFALFGYFDAHFEEGTIARYIADKGWEGITCLYQNDHENYKACMQDIKATIDSLGDSKNDTSSSNDTDDSSQQTSLPLVADDEYATIWFSGCEKKNSSETNVCFVVQNKTDYQLTVGVDSLAINGWSLTDVFVWENVAPNSKANIKIATEQLGSLKVDSITGTLQVVDMNKNLWGANNPYRDYPIKYSAS